MANKVDSIEAWLINEISVQRGVSRGNIHGLTAASYSPLLDRDLLDAIRRRYGVSISQNQLSNTVIRDLARTLYNRQMEGRQEVPPPLPNNSYSYPGGEYNREKEEVKKWIKQRMADLKGVSVRLIQDDDSVWFSIPANNTKFRSSIKKKFKIYKLQTYPALAVSHLTEIIYALQNLPEYAEGSFAQIIISNLLQRQRKSRHCLMFGYAWLIPFLVLTSAAFVEPDMDMVAVGVVIFMSSPFLLLGWWQLYRSRKFSRLMREYRIAYNNEGGEALFSAQKIS